VSIRISDPYQVTHIVILQPVRMQLSAKLLLYLPLAHAAVVPAVRPRSDLVERDPQLGTVIGGIVGEVIPGAIGSTLQQLSTAISAGNLQGVLTQIRNLTPAKRPGSVDETRSILQAIGQKKPATILEYNALLIANGVLSGNVEGLFDFAQGVVSAAGGSNNRSVIRLLKPSLLRTG